MKKEFNFFIGVLVFFCLSSVVFCAEINVRQGDIEETSFEIRNTYSEELLYSIYSVGWKPWIFFSYSQILLDSDETKNIHIFLIPNTEVKPNIYNIDLIAESAKDIINKNLEVRVLRAIEKPIIKTFLFDDKIVEIEIDSTEKLTAKLEIYKNGGLIKSVEKDISVGENKIYENLKLDNGDYITKLKIYKGEELVDEAEKVYSKEFVSGITQKKEEWNYLIASGSKIIFENKGEQLERKEYVVLVSKSKNSFFNAKEYKEKTEEGDTIKYKWDFVLLHNQKYVITYSYNYSILFILSIILASFGILLYFSVRTDLKIKKTFGNKVYEIKEDKKIKICIEIINKTKHELSSIVVEDYVQPLFELKKDFFGIKPSRINKIGEELKLVWEIPKLEPKETRIFTYTIIPKIGVGDKYSFSLAKVRYKKDKVRKVVLSNHLRTGD